MGELEEMKKLCTSVAKVEWYTVEGVSGCSGAILIRPSTEQGPE